MFREKEKRNPKGAISCIKNVNKMLFFFKNYYYNLKKGGRSAVKGEVRVILSDINVLNQPQIKGEDL